MTSPELINYQPEAWGWEASRQAMAELMASSLSPLAKKLHNEFIAPHFMLAQSYSRFHYITNPGLYNDPPQDYPYPLAHMTVIWNTHPPKYTDTGAPVSMGFTFTLTDIPQFGKPNAVKYHNNAFSLNSDGIDNLILTVYSGSYAFEGLNYPRERLFKTRRLKSDYLRIKNSLLLVLQERLTQNPKIFEYVVLHPIQKNQKILVPDLP